MEISFINLNVCYKNMTSTLLSAHLLLPVLSQFGTSLFFHVQFSLLLPDLHTDFSRGRSGGLGFPSLEEFSTVCCDPHSHKVFSVVSEAEVDIFLEFPCCFYDPTDVDNLISGSSAFSKSSFYIWKFSVQVLLKSSL